MTTKVGLYKRTLQSLPLRGKTILLRVDYNIPLDDQGRISDNLRIRMSLPTIRTLLDEGCKVVVISHMGRPRGKYVARLSLEPAAARLATLLGRPVRFVDTCIGEKARMAVKRAPKASVIVLENLRFNPGEERNDPQLARELARVSGADYFIQDGFGVAHRSHASTDAITQFLPSVAGKLLEYEYNRTVMLLDNPRGPVVSILGGDKIGDKIYAIEKLIDVSDHIVVGGMIANTFLRHKGVNIRKSRYELGQDKAIDRIYKRVADKVGYENVDKFILLPTDVAVSSVKEPDAKRHETDVWHIPEGSRIIDLGRQSTARAVQQVERARTILWNGHLGIAERQDALYATKQIAMAVKANRNRADSIVGGRSIIAFLTDWDIHRGKYFTHISSGGGACLLLMSGQKLPGIERLLDAKNKVE